MALMRKSVEAIKPYTTGKPIETVVAEYGLSPTDIVKMASNENPHGTSPKAVEAMCAAASGVNVYPDPVSRVLSAALAQKYGVLPENIQLSAGMDSALLFVTMAFVESDEEVLTCSPSFDSYRIDTAIAGGRFKSVPLKDHTFDLDALYDAITDKTKVIFICNPNNPTGTIVSREKVKAFMNRIPENIVVMFDEAYAEFVTDTSYAQGLEYVFEGRNVIVGRTFSKLYGMAGARVGYTIAPKHIMDAIKRVAPPFPVNKIAQAGALAALGDTEFARLTLTENERCKQYLLSEFDKLGFNAATPNGNFIWTDMHTDSHELENKLLRHGVIFRAGYQWGFDTFMRVSIGSMSQCVRAVEVLKSVL